MYELWLTLREWANYNQLNQTIEKNWLSNSFNSHILDLLDKEEIKYRSEKRLLGYRNKGKRRLAGNANQPIVINIDDVADVIDVRAEDEFARVELLVSLKQEFERLSPRELMIIRTYLDYPIEVVARKLKVRPNTISKARRKIARKLRKKLVWDEKGRTLDSICKAVWMPAQGCAEWRL